MVPLRQERTHHMLVVVVVKPLKIKYEQANFFVWSPGNAKGNIITPLHIIACLQIVVALELNKILDHICLQPSVALQNKQESESRMQA